MSAPTAPRSFQTTRWIVVRQAASSTDPTAQQALASLCESYWYPVYAFIRRSGKGPQDADNGPPLSSMRWGVGGNERQHTIGARVFLAPAAPAPR